jgi:hypothetical protein
MLVNETDHPKQFQKRVLQWCCGEQQLRRTVQCLFKGIGNHVGWLVHVAQSVCLIDDYEVPRSGTNIRRFVPGKML